MMKKKAFVIFFLLSTVFILKTYSYTVQNGCPDFSDIQKSYVEGYTGDFSDPFQQNGITDGRHTLISEKEFDENTGSQLSTLPPGETRAIRLGNDKIGGEAEAIVYHFIVDPDNSLLFINFAVVLEDPGHDFIYQPRFVIRITDKQGKLVSDCSEYDVSAAAGLSGFKDYLGGHTAVRWRDWTKVGLDLTPFANQEVQVQFITYDCALMGHFGYAYFTAHCAPNKLEIKGCTGTSFTVSAPDGFASYLWDNGDTTRTTTRQITTDNMAINCLITSVTGCSFTQSASISSTVPETETFFKDTICQGEPYNKHYFNLPPQYTTGTTIYHNSIFDPSTCSETTEIQLELTILQQFYEINAAICEGEDFDKYGFHIVQPPVGTYFDTLRFSHNETRRCDSIVCLKLTINESLNLSQSLIGDASPCTGVATPYYVDADNNSTSYSWEIPDNAVIMNGKSSPQILLYFTSDEPGRIVLKGENGCGTGAVPFDVKPKLSHHIFIEDTACVNQYYNKYNFNLGKQTTTGYYTYTQNLQTSSGCDSTIVLALSVFNTPNVWIEMEDNKQLLCASDRVLLQAKGEGSNYLIHTCDSLPVTVGDVYCKDGSIKHLNQYDTNSNQAAGVVFFVSPDYQYALVADIRNLYHRDRISWGVYGYDIPNLTNQTEVRKVTNDQDGYSNTAIIRMTGDASSYPAAWAVDFENGWYLPAIGELRLLYASIHEINKTLSVIGGNEMPSNTNDSSFPFNYYSSTELSAYYFCVVTQTGEIQGNGKIGNLGSIRQIRSVKLPEMKLPSVKIGDIVQNEYGEKGMVFHLNDDGRSGLMLNLTEDTFYYQFSPDTFDIPEWQHHSTASSPYFLELAAHEDWDGEANTEILKKSIPQDENYAICHVDTDKGWFIPSAGQLDEIYSLLFILDSALVKHNAQTMFYDHYWSSTRNDVNTVWSYDMAFGNPDVSFRNEWNALRTISKFTYCEPYAEVTDSSISFQWNTGETTPYLEIYPKESSTYTVTAYTKEGCSSSASKYLIVNQQEDNIDIFDTICFGERYVTDFFDVNESGVYTHTIENDKCNQTITLHLTVTEEQKETRLEDQTCQGSNYRRNGFNITANIPGSRIDTLFLTNKTGCDSLIILHLNVLPMRHDTIYDRICQNESYFQKGYAIAAYQPIGWHYYDIKTADENGCDIIQTLALKVDSIYQLSLIDSTCMYEKYTKNGFDITPDQEGYNHFYQTLHTQSGCDSTIALNLKVFSTDETQFIDTIVVGDSYQSKDFSLPAQYTIGWQTHEKHLTNHTGCDSLLILNLYVQNDEDIVKIPSSFTPNDQNGINDIFMEGYEIFIYDRYGLLVCHSNNGWDGQYRGAPADPGVYIYTLIFKSGKEKHGTVEIIAE
ncbi:MAG: gliding motility-associated C-terminal domain-containing protein [Paludibacteraceae bacterium]|nr:gliding motility-associated C-terminal domain-containing protein [Paludibacteraceae bacterium]